MWFDWHWRGTMPLIHVAKIKLTTNQGHTGRVLLVSMLGYMIRIRMAYKSYPSCTLSSMVKQPSRYDTLPDFWSTPLPGLARASLLPQTPCARFLLTRIIKRPELKEH